MTDRHRIVAYASLDQLVESLESAVERATPAQLSRFVQERLEAMGKAVREKLDEAYGANKP